MSYSRVQIVFKVLQGERQLAKILKKTLEYIGIWTCYSYSLDRGFPEDILHLLLARLSPVYLSDVGDIYMHINQSFISKESLCGARQSSTYIVLIHWIRFDKIALSDGYVQ